MGVQRTISLHIQTHDRGILTAIDLLCQAHWTPYNSQGRIEILAVGDTEDFNVVEVDTWDEARATLTRRAAQGEFGYLILWDQETGERLTLFIYPQPSAEPYQRFELRVVLGWGQRLARAAQYTDFSYYLERFLPSLEVGGFSFTRIVCEDLD
jgi:hypothetical protein